MMIIYKRIIFQYSSMYYFTGMFYNFIQQTQDLIFNSEIPTTEILEVLKIIFLSKYFT